jgi:hypothetical protein
MWTIGFQPNGCASPVLLRKDGEMLAFAHIPTGNHSNNKEGFIIFDFEGRAGRAGGSPSVSQSRLAGKRAAARAVPDQKAGPVFFAKGEGKKSSGPAAPRGRAPRF